MKRKDNKQYGLNAVITMDELPVNTKYPAWGGLFSPANDDTMSQITMTQCAVCHNTVLVENAIKNRRKYFCSKECLFNYMLRNKSKSLTKAEEETLKYFLLKIPIVRRKYQMALKQKQSRK